MIFYILLTIAILLAALSFFGPTLLAARNVTPAKYHRYIKRIPIFFLGYVITLITLFISIFQFGAPDSMSLIANIAGIMFMLFPAFTTSFYRLYESDFKMFGPTDIHTPFINPSLDLEGYKQRLQKKIRIYNTLQIIAVCLALITFLYSINLSRNQYGLFFALIPVVSAAIFLMLTIRLVMTPQKIEPIQDQLDILQQETAEIAGAMEIKPPKVFLHPGLITVPYNCIAMPKGMYVSTLLMRDFSSDERKFVIAHELAHFKLNHIAMRLRLRYFGMTLLFFMILPLLLNAPPPVTTWTMGIVMTGIFSIAYFSRKLYARQEYEADAEAIRITGNPLALKSCLYKICSNSLFPNLSEFDNPTHPSNPNRYAAALEVGQKEH